MRMRGSAIVISVVIGGSAHADVTVMWRPDSSSSYTDISTQPDVNINAGSSPNVTLQNRGGQYWIMTDDVSPGQPEPIGTITIQQGAGPAGTTAALFITGNSDPSLGSTIDTIPGVGDLGGIDQTTELVTLRANILGDIVGNITCDVLKDIYVNGQVAANATLTHQSSKGDRIDNLIIQNGDFLGTLNAIDGDLLLMQIINGSFSSGSLIRVQRGYFSNFDIIKGASTNSGNFQGSLVLGFGAFGFSDGVGIIEVTGGNIVGTSALQPAQIIGTSHGIDEIIVNGEILTGNGGGIGLPGQPYVTIGDVGSLEITRIGSIICEQLHANIRITSFTPDVSSIDEIQILGDLDGHFDGDWSGSLVVGRLASGTAGLVFVDGACSADIKGSVDPSNSPINEFVAIGQLTSDVLWISGDGLETGSLVVLDDGLAGQIVLAAQPLSGTSIVDDWDGDIDIQLSDSSVHRFGPGQSQPYKAPHYEALSSQLGGGAIGLLPYNFHQRESAPPAGETRDCDPYQNELVTLGMADPLSHVTISHYGPVYIVDPNDGPHFKVEYKLLEARPWQDRTSLFEVDTTLTAIDDRNTLNRDVVIKGTSSNPNGFKSVGYWRIRPIEGKVKCGSSVIDANAQSDLDVLYDSSITGPDAGTIAPDYEWYGFQVQLLSSMGSSIMPGGTASISDAQLWSDEPFETNADGSTDTLDLVEVLNAINE